MRLQKSSSVRLAVPGSSCFCSDGAAAVLWASYGRACVGKSWERLPAHSQAGRTPATVTWRSLKAAPSPIEFQDEGSPSQHLFFFFNLFFKVDLLFSDFYSVWVFFFSSAAQHAKCQFSNQGPKPWPLQWKLGDPATGLKGSLSSRHLACRFMKDWSHRTQATCPSIPHPQKLWDYMLLF